MVEISQLKALKKELKIFQKLAKSDTSKAKEKAKELLLSLKPLMNDKEIMNNEKYKNELNKIKEILELFIQNINSMEKINKKWE